MVISCQNLAFGYDGHSVISGLNFSVEAGDFLLIAGENGSGKSTLIKGLLRLIPPLEGTITFSPECTPSRTGYLSQQTAAKQDFPAGVFEIALSGNLRKKGLLPFYRAAEKRKTEDNLRLLGIAELKDRCFRELSGGQQRRVLLARSLCAAEKTHISPRFPKGLFQTLLRGNPVSRRPAVTGSLSDKGQTPLKK